MAELWPRNIIPYTENELRTLATTANARLYRTALDTPLRESKLTADQSTAARELLAAGLLSRGPDGTLVPTNRHKRDPDTGVDVPGHLEHKREKLDFLKRAADETRALLDARGAARTRAALGVVTLPDTPDVIAQANAILAEAEDQLRALAEENPLDGTGTARVVIFVGSAPS